MTMSEVVSVAGDDFSGSAQHEDTRITVSLKGNADYAALDALEMMLDRLHEQADRLSIKEAVVDLRQLEFMNSSCFKSVVNWITEIQQMEAERQYRVTFLSNPKLHWQKRSLHSLRCFAVELITVIES
jgi:anti-anti-sigma factor